MKVIKAGRPQKGWAAEQTCRGPTGAKPPSGCGAKLFVEEADVIVRYVGGSFCENGDPVCCFKCPQCGQVTRIKPQPPAEVLDAARRRER